MKELEIPAGVGASVDLDVVTVKGSLGSNSRRFNSALLSVKVAGNKITITPNSSRILGKKAYVAQTSFAKELSNDMQGVMKYFEIKMQSTHAHFPLTLEQRGNVLMIKNMIGERAPRSANVVGNTKIEVKGQDVRLYGTSLDDVSQTAANIRKACKTRRKDERVFQDGVYYAIEE